jgi:hypothetical protein
MAQPVLTWLTTTLANRSGLERLRLGVIGNLSASFGASIEHGRTARQSGLGFDQFL